MKRKTRRILFYVAVVVFVGLTYVAVIYAQGYKYSFEDGKFTLTGAIYVKANTDAKVYFNDELVGTTSFLGNSFSKGGLLPGQYLVMVTREGYTSWEKVISVQEGFLSEFSKIMLLPDRLGSDGEEARLAIVREIEELLYPPPSSPSPSPSPSLSKRPVPTPRPSPSPSATPIAEPFYIKNNKLFRNTPEPDVIADNVVGFALSPNENKLAWWNVNNEIWVVWLNDTNYQPHHKRGDMEKVTRFATRIKKIGWFRDEDHIVVDSVGYKIVEIDTRGEVNIIKI